MIVPVSFIELLLDEPLAMIVIVPSPACAPLAPEHPVSVPVKTDCWVRAVVVSRPGEWVTRPLTPVQDSTLLYDAFAEPAPVVASPATATAPVAIARAARRRFLVVVMRWFLSCCEIRLASGVGFSDKKKPRVFGSRFRGCAPPNRRGGASTTSADRRCVDPPASQPP